MLACWLILKLFGMNESPDRRLLTCMLAGFEIWNDRMKALEACTLYSFEGGKGTGSGAEAAPKASTLLAGENWSITGDKDVIILKLSVGESPPKEKFKVETAPDQAGLAIRTSGPQRRQ
jgi:hypothetical protein